MLPTHLREIKHIAANFSERKIASGYRIDSVSDTSRALHDLIKRKLIEVVSVKGFYIYLRPAKNISTKLSVQEKQRLGLNCI